MKASSESGLCAMLISRVGGFEAASELRSAKSEAAESETAESEAADRDAEDWDAERAFTEMGSPFSLWRILSHFILAADSSSAIYGRTERCRPGHESASALGGQEAIRHQASHGTARDIPSGPDSSRSTAGRIGFLPAEVGAGDRCARRRLAMAPPGFRGYMPAVDGA